MLLFVPHVGADDAGTENGIIALRIGDANDAEDGGGADDGMMMIGMMICPMMTMIYSLSEKVLDS